jgi:hypothetical protein
MISLSGQGTASPINASKSMANKIITTYFLYGRERLIAHEIRLVTDRCFARMSNKEANLPLRIFSTLSPAMFDEFLI